MGPKVLVDTDILIKTYRGNRQLYKELQHIRNDFAISVITAMELYTGAGTVRKRTSMRRELKAYEVLHLSEAISVMALKFYATYQPASKLLIPDFLVAATALTNGMQLFTHNKKDFSIIRGLRFYNEKFA